MTSTNGASPSAPICTSLTIQTTRPPLVREQTRKYRSGPRTPKLAAVPITALGPLPDPELVLPTVATVLGLTEAGPTPPEGVTATLRPKPLLFLLSIGTQTRP